MAEKSSANVIRTIFELLVLLAALGVISVFLANYLFSWDSRHSTRRGHPLMALLVLVTLIAGILLV